MFDTQFLGEICDFLAGCTIQIGNYFKIKKMPTGWLISIMAIGYWIVRANMTGFGSQMFWHIVSLQMAIFGYYKWIKDKDL